MVWKQSQVEKKRIIDIVRKTQSRLLPELMRLMIASHGHIFYEPGYLAYKQAGNPDPSQRAAYDKSLGKRS